MALFGIADAVVGVVGNVLDKFVEDKDLRAKLNHELKTQVQEASRQSGTGKASLYLCCGCSTCHHVDMCLWTWLAIRIPASMHMGYGYLDSRLNNTYHTNRRINDTNIVTAWPWWYEKF